YRDGFLLQLPATLREAVTTRLRMYVLRAKVTLAPADGQLMRLGLAGPNAPELLRATLGALPDADDAVASADDVLIVRVAGAHPRFQLLAAPARAAALWTTLARAATPA